jgi:hypothetical protein
VKDKELSDNLVLVTNEIKKQLVLTPNIKYSYSDQLTPDKITPEIAEAAKDYVEIIRKVYVNRYNDVSNRKEALKSTLSGENLQKFLKLRDGYFNKTLEDFVRNKNETIKTITYKGELMQKFDPIFMDSKYNLIKAHFYAPEKQIFGAKVDTYLVNLIVLWFITFLLYMALYFRLLKKLLESGEYVLDRRRKLSD